jgi:hypothetical protein
LQKRKVNVSAKVKCLLTAQETQQKSVEEIEKLVQNEFSFDNFKNQEENGVIVNEETRADGLHRVLYKCPACGCENTHGSGEDLSCLSCGKQYRLEENGQMKAIVGDTEFKHIPDWFNWQRKCVKEEISKGEYNLSVPVDFGVLSGYKSFYMVGEGVLTHDKNGLAFESNDGKIKANQKPLYSYSVNADFYWYEGGDVISFGNSELLYYCFPQDKTPVAKIRFAVEELYKLYKSGEIK